MVTIEGRERERERGSQHDKEGSYNMVASCFDSLGMRLEEERWVVMLGVSGVMSKRGQTNQAQ